MSETLHRKLSILVAKTGRKKVDQSAGTVAGRAQGGGCVGAIAVVAPKNRDIEGIQD
jgi:hypothetical protein